MLQKQHTGGISQGPVSFDKHAVATNLPGTAQSDILHAFCLL